MNGKSLALFLLLGGCAGISPHGVDSAPHWSAGQAPAGPALAAVRNAQARAAQVDGPLHAIIAFDPSAEAQAATLDTASGSGSLHGKPVLLKDNIEAAGALPTTAGSLALKDNVTGRDAPLVAKLRAAGAVILGKANLSEWANIRSTKSISGWSAIGGQTRNPYALDRNTCGSSSGSGAAVAAGIVDYAIGTETDGSVTCPASMNGIVGLKPTVGLVSRTRIVPISASQDTAGPMTRTVLQAAELLNAIAGSDPADPATKEADARKVDYVAALQGASLKGKRLGVMRFASGFGTDPLLEQAIALLKREGATIVGIKDFDDKGMGEAELAVLLTELKAGMNAYLATTPATVQTRTLADLIAFNKARAAEEMGLFGQELFEQAEKTKGLDDPAYKKARALSLRKAGAEGIDRMVREHKLDALIGPTYPAAWLIDPVHGDQVPGSGGGSLAAIAGYPHLTVPMGLVKGLPVGLSFIGPRWSDAKMLAMGAAFEAARGPFPAPRFLPSVDAAPELAPLLDPVKR